MLLVKITLSFTTRFDVPLFELENGNKVFAIQTHIYWMPREKAAANDPFFLMELRRAAVEKKFLWWLINKTMTFFMSWYCYMRLSFSYILLKWNI